MAVPKKKTSSSKRNMRRSHDKVKSINVVFNKETAELWNSIRVIIEKCYLISYSNLYAEKSQLC